MKTTIMSVLLTIFTAGCINFRSGNVAHDVQPRKYQKDTNAVTTVVTVRTNFNGKVEGTFQQTTLTPAALIAGVDHHKLDVAEAVEVSRAGGERIISSGGVGNFGGDGGVNTTGSGYVTPYGGGYGNGGVNTTGGWVGSYSGGGNAGGVNTTGGWVNQYRGGNASGVTTTGGWVNTYQPPR